MRKFLLLVRACVNSGMCCKKGPCAYGKWDSEKGQCAYLAFNEKQHSRCLKYDEISQDPASYYNPAFGQGCCMSLFNEARDSIIKRDYNGVIPMVEIEGY